MILLVAGAGHSTKIYFNLLKNHKTYVKTTPLFFADVIHICEHL